MGLRRPLTGLELGVITEAFKFKNSRATVTAILPNGKSHASSSVAVNSNEKIRPRDLRNYFTRHNILIHCACMLIAKTKDEKAQCILKFRQRKTKPPVTWCTHYELEIGYFRNCKDKPYIDQTYWYAVERPCSTTVLKSLEILEVSRATCAQPRTPEKSRKTRSSLSQVATGIRKPLENAANNLKKSLKGKKKQTRSPSSERYASLSPTPTTSSVEAYRMTNGPHTQWSSESAGPSSATSVSAPGPSSPASEGCFRVLFTQANKEFKNIAPYIGQASNRDVGGPAYELEGVLNKCDHCRKFFLPVAYKIHVQKELGLNN
ncbi:hypothetical protein M422DRAFT_253497 [Sphaerobolus stellatus SS14]|uniref:Uncharacterized protein n=1 Tax=Sphaerobolus stellatus (strain SS14) TaxID=990650 RepID=A0A0C9VMZ5_SPHS4|nr:hypothetical protein M422DRAFT_253497 [Sphaerobolus stellatus SS14]